ncbi:MAG: hypothetical protein IJ521_06390, partial [Schwartzia sp.]|nr:hypothetical protein [Schwartzia sp. (in: firmicutes)]
GGGKDSRKAKKDGRQFNILYGKEVSGVVKQRFYARMDVEDGELEEIFSEMREAQKTIYRCYSRLEELGVLVYRKKEADDARPTAPESDQSVSNSLTN